MSESTEDSTTTSTGDAISSLLSNGRFQCGHSGNPGGRPKIPAALRDGMRALADDAMWVLREALSSVDEGVRLMAAEMMCRYPIAECDAHCCAGQRTEQCQKSEGRGGHA